MTGRRVRVFISYAHADRDVVERLGTHLRWLEHDQRVAIFDDSKLTGGERWERRLLEEIGKADIVLLVVTADFTASHYCTQVELKAALARCETGDICLIPILAAPCDWEAMPITDRQALPKDAKLRLKARSRWGAAKEEAFTQIAKHVRKNVEAIAARLAEADSDNSSPPVHLKSPEPISGTWRQPEPPDRCLGRADDLATLLAALAGGRPRPIVVYGGAGMGKSTLTCEAACHPEVSERFGARRVWVGLDRAPDPAAAIAALHDALALPPEQEPWRGITAELGAAPALVVLDNLETPWAHHQAETEGLVARLARIPGVALMASLRSGGPPPRPAWGTRLEVLRLVGPYDRDLLLAIAGDIPSTDPLLPEVLAALDGWPLAIELFAAEAVGLGELDLPWRLWRDRRSVLRSGEGAEPDPLAVSLGASLASPRMRLPPPHPPDAALRLYAMLGRLPDGLARRDADALLPGCGGEAVACLLRTRLAHPDGGRLRMLAPVREHAAGIEVTAADRDVLHGHYLGLAAELLRYSDGDHRGIDLPRLRAELVNIDALIARAIDPNVTLGADAAFQRELGGLALAIGDARRVLGHLALALQAYQQARGVFSDLASCDPGNAEWQRDLSVSWERLGDVRRAQGDLPGALQAFTEGKDIRDRLAAADPGNAQWQRDLSVSWNKLGDVRVAQGDLPGALQAFTEGKDIRDRLATADPGNAQWQRDLSVSWERLGDVRVAQGDLPRALQAFTEGKDIADKLAAADPGNAQWQRDLSVSWERLGDVRVAQGDLPRALQAFTEGKDIADRLATADPGNAQWQRDLVVSYVKLAETAAAGPQPASAATHYREALRVARELAASGRLAPADAWIVGELEQRLAATAPAPDPPT